MHNYMDNENIKIKIKKEEIKEEKIGRGRMKKEILIRIAWFDREYKKYDFGAWKNVSSVDLNWINSQNKKYPRVKYWIEAIDKDNMIRNIEYYDLIGVENEKMEVWLAI